MIVLRPHHLLCIRNFIGEGYSNDFVENMKSLIITLEETPNQKVLIKSELDDICLKCPENKLEKCNSEDKVVALDKNVLECLSINDGEIHIWSEIKLKANQKITKEQFKNICSDCKWYYICSNKFK